MSDLNTIERAINELATKSQEAAKANREEIAELSEGFTKLMAKYNDLAQHMSEGMRGMPGGEVKTASAIVRESKDFQAFLEAGTKNAKATIAVPYGALLATKNTVVGDGANERVLAPHARLGEIVTAAERRAWLRQQIPTRPTGAAFVEFPVETFTSGAGTQVNGSSSESQFEGALKPQSSATYELKQTRVLTIAHYIKVSKQALDDSGIGAHLDGRLRYFLELALEDQILMGDGITELTGMLTTGNHTALSGSSSGDTIIDAVHRAITQLAEGDYMASAIVMSPAGWQSVALLKDLEERYLHGMPATGGPRTLWGVPVFLSASMADNKFIVADMPMACELQARQDGTVEMGYTDDDFIRNLVTMRAELRMALCILRPAAIIVGDV